MTAPVPAHELGYAKIDLARVTVILAGPRTFAPVAGTLEVSGAHIVTEGGLLNALGDRWLSFERKDGLGRMMVKLSEVTAFVIGAGR